MSAWPELFVLSLIGLGLFVLAVEPVNVFPWWVGIIGSVMFIGSVIGAVYVDMADRRRRQNDRSM